MTKYDDTFLIESVKQAYSSVAKTGSAPEYAAEVAESVGYTRDQLESIPKESHMGLGCGNPTVTATLKPGENVLDLGSGGGIDIFLAALKIGAQGKAVGLDISTDMVKRARENARKRGLFPPHVSFVECSLADTLPINSNSIDCVLSNCVINLLPQSGKNHIFKEIYRVLKPGGRLVLDDILSKEELPAHIRDDMKQYISCIGGAIQVHEYNELLDSAGFKESMFVDSEADLNIYLMAANAGSMPITCCSLGPEKAQMSSSRTVDMDLNQWAASYQIYSRKPNDSSGIVCSEPLERWWDAFPVGWSTDVAPISPTELAAMLRNDPADVSVIDVRGEDRDGGHINGSFHFPAQTFHNQLAEFHGQFAAAGAVVFYCGGSVGRGPRCAGWYQDFLHANAIPGPTVLILNGGFRRWAEESGDMDAT
ncbi:S-adenosyl-L-methionine-dependent methyltransferase [Mycena maculata]|uniref:Arsenite methyltransferase n=1 Tax=Mycena maculata TaxID=230809 RepID=A0AAD7IB82_9AGAR|nr:S-adenosyl-L-methionine-dependent methyltransferase [Mycena maculata]